MNDIPKASKKVKHKRILYVKHTSNKELENKWGFNPYLQDILYIQCNKDGHVNWEHASIHDEEATLLDHVVVITK